MIFWLQFILGSALIAVAASIWFAQKSERWKLFLEQRFLLPGDGLFDKGKRYSGYVRWLRYVALAAGLAMVVPTVIIWDIIIGLIAAGLYWWMSRQKILHDDAFRQSVRSSAAD